MTPPPFRSPPPLFVSPGFHIGVAFRLQTECLSLLGVQGMLEEVQQSLLDEAAAFRDANIVDVATYEELKAVVAEGKWARGPWAGALPYARPWSLSPMPLSQILNPEYISSVTECAFAYVIGFARIRRSSPSCSPCFFQSTHGGTGCIKLVCHGGGPSKCTIVLLSYYKFMIVR